MSEVVRLVGLVLPSWGDPPLPPASQMEALIAITVLCLPLIAGIVYGIVKK